jgi:hypothetical protein
MAPKSTHRATPWKFQSEPAALRDAIALKYRIASTMAMLVLLRGQYGLRSDIQGGFDCADWRFRTRIAMATRA